MVIQDYGHFHVLYRMVPNFSESIPEIILREITGKITDGITKEMPEIILEEICERISEESLEVLSVGVLSHKINPWRIPRRIPGGFSD